MVTIYTDGACQGNPGKGAYATILKYGEHTKIITQGFRKTTNNRMELTGVIAGLEALLTNTHPIIIYSDSKYVVDAMQKGWLKDWVAKDFNQIKNKDLWLRFLQVSQNYDMTFSWLQGHAGHAINELCDRLAKKAMAKKDLAIDHGYEALQHQVIQD